MNTWISIKAQFPPIDEWILFKQNDLRHSVDKVNEHGDCFTGHLDNYTHWMPLPDTRSISQMRKICYPNTVKTKLEIKEN
jgi:hypothetical protein